LGGRKGIRPRKKTECWDVGVLICLERGADLHIAQLMPLPLTVSSVKSRLVLPFWYRLTRVVPEKGPLNGCVYIVSTFVTFYSVSLLVDFLLVVNLLLLITVLLTSATCVFVVNVQGLVNLSQGRIGAMFVTNVLHGGEI